MSDLKLSPIIAKLAKANDAKLKGLLNGCQLPKRGFFCFLKIIQKNYMNKIERVKKMLKNKTFLSLVLVLVLLASLSLPVFAASTTVEQQVEQTNQQVYQLIAQAKVKANQCTILYQNRVTAEKAILAKDKSQAVVVAQRIACYKNDYNNQINNIGNNLIADAYNKVLDLYNATSRSKVVFSVEYIPVLLGDKIFLVDPLKII